MKDNNSVEAPASTSPRTSSRRCSLLQTLLRINAVLLTIVVIAVMVNAKQTLRLGPISKKARWNDSKAFVALVVISAIALGYSFIQAILSLIKFHNNGLGWISFVLDQLLTYALLGAAAASAEVAYLAKHGSSAAMWNPVCNNFDTFCTRAGAAIILSFIAVLAMALSTAISAYHLFKHKI